MDFGIIGINHHCANAAIRDRVAFDESSARQFQAKLASVGVRQSLVLSTCNRCEVAFFGGDGVSAVVERAFLGWFPDVAQVGCFERRIGDDALVYLFRIAAGLESMILGEYQILGQVKSAYALSLAAGFVGKEMDRVLRSAISCAKAVKTALDIGAVPPSVCQAGVAYIRDTFGIADKRVFVIGSGRTGTLAAKLARKYGAREIVVCNRSRERAQRLIDEVGAKVVDYSERYLTIADSDVVISATASPHMVVRADLVKLSGDVVFLDLASPRDVDPAVADNPLAKLISIDGIGELAAGDRAERERLSASGMKLIVKAVAVTSAWLATVASEGEGK